MTTRPKYRSTVLFAVLAAALAFTPCLRGRAEDEKKDDATPSEVSVGKIKLNVPAAWEQEEPLSRLRLAQFKIAPAEGDKEAAELAIFSFGASDLAANIKRWISQFQPDGRTVKITTGESETGKYVFVELSGTYNKPVGPPIEMKTEPVPGSRALGVILVAPEKGVFYFKMTGADKTVAQQANPLRMSFGADASKEKELKLDE